MNDMKNDAKKGHVCGTLNLVLRLCCEHRVESRKSILLEMND